MQRGPVGDFSEVEVYSAGGLARGRVVDSAYPVPVAPQNFHFLAPLPQKKQRKKEKPLPRSKSIGQQPTDNACNSWDSHVSCHFSWHSRPRPSLIQLHAGGDRPPRPRRTGLRAPPPPVSAHSRAFKPPPSHPLSRASNRLEFLQTAIAPFGHHTKRDDASRAIPDDPLFLCQLFTRPLMWDRGCVVDVRCTGLVSGDILWPDHAQLSEPVVGCFGGLSESARRPPIYARDSGLLVGESITPARLHWHSPPRSGCRDAAAPNA